MKAMTDQEQSQRPEDVVIPFGSHRGERLGDVLDADPKYLDWLRGIDIQNARLREAVEQMNEKYAGRIEAAVGE
jgi:hypothetical protein